MPTDLGDVIEVAARAEFNGTEDIINVYQFSLGTPGPVSDEQTVDDIINIMELIYSILITFQTGVVLYRDLRLRNVTQTRVLGVHPWPTLTAGESESVPMPPGNAVVMNFTTDVPRVTPRKFLGGLVVATLDPDGSLTTSTVLATLEIADILLNVQSEVGGDYLYGHFSAKTLKMEFPLGAVVSDVSGYQRRRKQGRGS